MKRESKLHKAVIVICFAILTSVALDTVEACEDVTSAAGK
jgi:hypothetical protein